MKSTRSTPVLALLALFSLGALPAAAPDPALEVDVVVYGATSAGVIAAYTAKEYGKSVLLVEPGRHVGGLSSGGLGYTDIGNKYAVTGLGLDFYRRLGRYYGKFEEWTFEPRAAEQVFESYLDRAGVEVLYSRRLKSVAKDGTRIRAVTLEYDGAGKGSPDLVVAAKEFIDATYEGDLMARSGASYTVGRESNARYGETIDGVQLRDKHQFPDGVDPYVRPGDPSSGLLPEITGVGVAPDGTGDEKVQAYNFRLAMCQGESRVPITRPARYDSARYALLLRLMEKAPWTGIRTGFKIDRLVNGETDWNNQGPFSTDFIGHSWAYPDAAYARRDSIWRAHEDYEKGLLYFVGHDPRVPEKLREEMLSWGYCSTEFLDTDGWPHQLYVREARRMVGETVLTEHDLVAGAVPDDTIALGSYHLDIREVQRSWITAWEHPDAQSHVVNEGYLSVAVPAYGIPYRALLPRATEASNLLAAVCVSASHVAFSSIRMEPQYQMLGQAAGTAAALAVRGAGDVHAVPVGVLREVLEGDGAVLVRP
jgi:hypothetical protein